MNGQDLQRNVIARRFSAGASAMLQCQVADEVPVALSFNGVAHVVLMATPADLLDLAAGFALTDGIADDIVNATASRDATSIRLDVTLSPAKLRTFLARGRQRNMQSQTGCGICGIATVAGLPRPPALSGAAAVFSDRAARRALAELPSHQVLNRATGATHAAAWAAPDGEILLVREDVGRHNALDKLIGARLRSDPTWRTQPGFCVITSRCSFEMVQKAASAGIGLLIAVSAPTALAIDQAEALGVTLVALARNDSRTMYAGAELAREQELA